VVRLFIVGFSRFLVNGGSVEPGLLLPVAVGTGNVVVLPLGGGGAAGLLTPLARSHSSTP
jgi:hypothetical protein